MNHGAAAWGTFYFVTGQSWMRMAREVQWRLESTPPPLPRESAPAPPPALFDLKKGIEYAEEILTPKIKELAVEVGTTAVRGEYSAFSPVEAASVPAALPAPVEAAAASVEGEEASLVELEVKESLLEVAKFDTAVNGVEGGQGMGEPQRTGGVASSSSRSGLFPAGDPSGDFSDPGTLPSIGVPSTPDPRLDPEAEAILLPPPPRFLADALSEIRAAPESAEVAGTRDKLVK